MSLARCTCWPLLLCLALNSVTAEDWPLWGGSSARNNVSSAKHAPTDWDGGQSERRTGKWKRETSRNIRWRAELGSCSYGGPVVADGRVFVGTNNARGYLKQYPSDVDLGCLLAFRESDGHFLWQYSSPKLATGRVHDWPMTGICSTPLVQGDRIWLVDNRGRVVCLDTHGYRDGQDDGPERDATEMLLETDADVVWRLDMMQQLGVSQHNMATCSPVAWGDTLFLCTSNGVDESHVNIPAPDAPSFIAVDKHSGQVLWTDNSPGANIHHGQWSSPAVGELGGVPQVIFPGGDGWLYSFRADSWNQDTQQPILLWKFDCNPKESVLGLGGRGTRGEPIAIPVIYEGRVYSAVGQDPEHGVGAGRLWCIDPTKRGDVSPALVVRLVDRKEVPVPHRRVQALKTSQGEFLIDNPNSAVVWKYERADQNRDGEFESWETLHHSISSPAIKDGLLFIPDLDGIVHCLDARTGKCHWTVDLLATIWSSPLIVGDKVYVCDEDGDVAILSVSADPSKSVHRPHVTNGRGEFLGYEPLHNITMESSIYSTPIVANDVLYVMTRYALYAIETRPK